MRSKLYSLQALFLQISRIGERGGEKFCVKRPFLMVVLLNQRPWIR